MGWEQFTEVFLKRFVPYNLQDQSRDEFDRLEQGSLSVSKYEARFHELSCYAISSIPIEFERIFKLIMGFASYLQEITTSFVLSGGTFQSIIDHARMIESILHFRQGSCAKKFHLQGQFNGHSSKGKDYSGQGL